ncbi:MAG: ECF-type sigma factor [Wenzhouxiangellaceae bacterium]|nr:ECF-type sigma factor [Wenzhouxiangellaceae bacterium]
MTDSPQRSASAADAADYDPLEDGEVTRLLNEVRESPDLFDRIVPLVYDDLKRIGHNQRRQFDNGVTMQTTALVHEAFLKLRDHASGPIENSLHLRRLAALVMRQLIVDYARKRTAQKRGSGKKDVELDEQQVGQRDPDSDLVLAMERLLADLERSNPRMAEVTTLRYYGGHAVEEIAEMLGVSGRTVSRDLTRARAWLKTALSDYEPEA